MSAVLQFRVPTNKRNMSLSLLLLLLLCTTAPGRPLAFASCAYTTTFPHPGWAEQNPQDWWQALGAAVKDAVQQSGVPASTIAAISLDTTNCTVVALDEGVLRTAVVCY
jgi:sugar (pentulose or hexulose) kinase